MLKALSHPTRVKALAIMSDRAASPSEIARQLDVELSGASYHVRVLEELGLIELVEEEPVRGSVAHFYRAVDQNSVDSPGWENLDSAGHLSRTCLLLDARGWEKVAEIQRDARERILEEQAKAVKRIDRDRDEATHAMVLTLFFKMLPLPSDK
jgi:DNA-binding transcriptional ArsR family regulator